MTPLRSKLKKRVQDWRETLQYDDTGMPPSEGNSQEIDLDPSRMSSLNLMPPGCPIGTGQGPALDKSAALNLPDLSPALQANFDNKAYKETGNLVRTPLYRTPQYMQPWTGNSPNVPFTQVPIFNLARDMRKMVDSAAIPQWASKNMPLRTGAGALAGAASGYGFNWLRNLLTGREDPGTSNAAIGAAVGGLMGWARRNA